MTDKKKALQAVRAEIDGIDDQIQDLLIQRTEIVEKVREIKEGEPVKNPSGTRSGDDVSPNRTPSWQFPQA